MTWFSGSVIWFTSPRIPSILFHRTTALSGSQPWTDPPANTLLMSLVHSVRESELMQWKLYRQMALISRNEVKLIKEFLSTLQPLRNLYIEPDNFKHNLNQNELIVVKSIRNQVISFTCSTWGLLPLTFGFNTTICGGGCHFYVEAVPVGGGAVLLLGVHSQLTDGGGAPRVDRGWGGGARICGGR